MAPRRMTFTFDEATATSLAQAANRLRIPESQVVREAILDFSERVVGKVSERERRERLRLFDTMIEHVPRRPPTEIAAELGQIRRARSYGGRATQPQGDP